MSEKTIKLQLEDEIIEFKIEENQSLELNIQNVDNELNINKSERTYLNQTNYDLYDQDYIASHHETSIYDVLNKNIDEEPKLDLEVTDFDNEETKEVENNTESDEWMTSLKENQSDRDVKKLSAYQNMISDALERFNHEEQKENNA